LRRRWRGGGEDNGREAYVTEVIDTLSNETTIIRKRSLR
jgi:hypothetical protein